ncbi:MAG: SIR2 family protein [Bryobacteraceae bacterium]|nr:SIR2 family protein [Bryobacteraceae bacterium]
MEPTGRKLDRLAGRIVSGDAVFFIGAGFSLDSEGNFAGTLIGRLLARLGATLDAIQEAEAWAPRELLDLRQDIIEGLATTFALGRECCWDAERFRQSVKVLANNYYLINDWLCTAFERLLRHWEAMERLEPRIRALENRMPQPPTQALETWRYVPLLELGRQSAGKALFLDTMGFADPGVMAGDPLLENLTEVEESYRQRLRPRHFVLAWLAMEGLLPVILTTNYDLLLEGAYRLAGMQPLPAPPDFQAHRGLPRRRRLRYFTRIADAHQFFAGGDAFQSAVIVKIHGCVQEYRQARWRGERDAAELASAGRGAMSERHGAGARAWCEALPSLVFTFREIQNWRDDSWSRDYLQTLLRTRTVVFAGYSGADPVIHDTFRTVYEEMASYRTEEPVAVSGTSSAPAFFFDIAENRAFHALEILRAASLAVGESEEALTQHANLLPFDIRGAFANLDEMMLWLFHLTYRQMQAEALESELRRAAYSLFGRPCPESEAAAVIENFRWLLEAEKQAVDCCGPQDTERSRRRLRQLTGWTAGFHRALFREFAAADLLLRSPQCANYVYSALRWPWYEPMSEHPDWAAWAAVLELALRRRAAQWAGIKEDWRRPGWWIEPVTGERAAVLLPAQPLDQARRPAPRQRLAIELEELRRMTSRRRREQGLDLLPEHVWTLRSETVPWWHEGDDKRLVETPSALTLWAWASGVDERAPGANERASTYFGGSRPKGKAA